ncbi:MAG TPA: hypothetical protein VH144_02445 [Candidatus Saccharimonadales bacterium]|jgi:hypothetical protein|nr:hypothetical protein [Candidatus Saccharimonadales bacterium]
MQNSSLTEAGLTLSRLLDNARAQVERREHALKGQKIHVAGAGATISSAYEQLRNAAEYTEEHLLLQRAIRRFYVRNMSFQVNKFPGNVIDELVIELTQAGYLRNDTVTVALTRELLTTMTDLYELYWKLLDAGITHKVAQLWILDCMSVQTEQAIDDPAYLLAFAHFAHGHFTAILDWRQYADDAGSITSTEYQNVLYVAVQKALLKSDNANIRTDLMQIYGVKTDDVAAFVTFNQKFDNLADASLTKKIILFVNKNGAPLRIMRAAFFDRDHRAALTSRSKCLSVVEQQIQQNYKDVKSRLNKGIIKSIIFLFITKVLIGLAIEVPYDLVVSGSILVLPLAINLVFPIFYMAFTRVTLKLPGEANTAAIKEYIVKMLYVSEDTDYAYLSAKPTQRSTKFNIIYGLMFVIVFGLVSYALYSWHFNILQGIIFFIFVSTASFLGFRLSLMVTELELVTTYQGLIAILRDFLYTPFILVGQWLSNKYARINIIALLLDMVIELPLKTLLRLVRQWTAFLNDKRDAIS